MPRETAAVCRAPTIPVAAIPVAAIRERGLRGLAVGVAARVAVGLLLGAGSGAAAQTPGGISALTPNGARCERAEECQSGRCFPGPAAEIQETLKYCLHPEANCAYPGRWGGKYGDTLKIDVWTLTCQNPNQTMQWECARHARAIGVPEGETRPCYPQFLP